jgi:hypothetical protein
MLTLYNKGYYSFLMSLLFLLYILAAVCCYDTYKEISFFVHDEWGLLLVCCIISRYDALFIC